MSRGKGSGQFDVIHHETRAVSNFLLTTGVLVHRHTGVCYLLAQTVNGVSVTLMVDQDGTPLVAAGHE